MMMVLLHDAKANLQESGDTNLHLKFPVHELVYADNTLLIDVERPVLRSWLAKMNGERPGLSSWCG